MRLQKKMVCSVLLLIFFATDSYAQRYFGVATGDYSGINGLYLNPANIAGSKDKVVVSLFSLNLGVDNNLGTLAKLSDIGNGNTNAFTNSGIKDFSMLAPVGEIRGPALMISLNDDHKQTFALTTRIRVMNQFNHFDQSLYSTVTSSDNTTSSQNYMFQTSKFNWTANVWSEVGLTYGLVILDQGKNQLKAGVTVRYLGGIDYLSLKGNNLNIKYTAGSDSFFASNSDLEFASNVVSADNGVKNGLNASDVLGSIFGSKQGSGFGTDIGVTYTYRIGDEGDVTGNSASGDGHKLSISAAVTDIGAIKYNEGNNFTVNVSGNGYLTGQGLSQNINNYNNFRSYMVTQGFNADTGAKATKVYMPTAFLFGADYQIHERFYVNFAYVANLANRQNFGNSYYNQVTITPRYDSRLITVGVPVTYSMLADDLKMGLGFRIAGFFFGSDDMLALFSSNQHGFNVYFGGFIPIYRKPAKDVDKID